MKFRLSSLLFATAVIALSITTFSQYHHIESLRRELDAERQMTDALKSELVVSEATRLAN